MHPKYFLAALLTAIGSLVLATEPVVLHKESFNSLQNQFYIDFPGALKSSGFILNKLEFLRQHQDQNQSTHIRLQQKYRGFLVYGGYAILHRDQRGKVEMNGVIYRNLDTELRKPAKEFIKNKKLALDQFKAKFQSFDQTEEKATPLVYIDENFQAHWAYRVSVLLQYPNKIPERPTAIIDATTYKAYLEWNDIKTWNGTKIAVKGMGYGGNKKMGQLTYGKDFPLLDISWDKVKYCYMENSSVKVFDLEHGRTSPKEVMRFLCKNNVGLDLPTFWTGYHGDGYDKENGAFSPANDAMYTGNLIKRMYQEWYGIEVLTRKGKPIPLIMRIHYDYYYENAYWDGKEMTFGDGGSMMYPLVSLTISAHEISHGFTEQNSGLEYTAQSGGINESFSDMAAKAAEFYSSGKNTWTIGEEILKEDSGIEALRYLDKPSRDGISIDSADEYTQGLDVHFSSGVFNRFFYLLAKSKGWNTRKAFQVMVKANMDYWTPTSNFDQAGCGVLSATRDLGYPIEEVQFALTEVAVNFSKC